MGFNNDYADDVLLTEEPLMMEESDDESFIELDPQSWQDFNSEELLNTYFALEEYYSANGFKFGIKFPDFCTRVMHEEDAVNFDVLDDTHAQNVYNICQRGSNNYRN